MQRAPKALIWLLPLGLLGLCWITRPFPHKVTAVRIATRPLSAAQVQNIAQAARYMDNTVIKPGEEFSFNQVVGPRTGARGYVGAPSYLEGESPSTLGGGICMLSSAVYQAALQGGLPVTERIPHLRTIRSVPPGLDATVWYGQADLRFRNNTPGPLRIRSLLQGDQLTLVLEGQAKAHHRIERQVKQAHNKRVQVMVFRDRQLVSRDLYRLP